MKKPSIKTAVLLRGGISALARDLKVTPATVSQWCSKDRNQYRPVPIERCVEIERITEGAVTRKDLRPHDWHRIWPELVERG